MRKIYLLVLGILLIGGLIYWDARQKNPPPRGRLQVVVSGYVPYTIVKQIAGETVSVRMLLPPGAEPHSFEPTPGALVDLHHADAFIYVSHDLEPWAADLAKVTDAQTHVLELGNSLHPEEDPHVWMNFKKARLMGYQVTALLAEMAPESRKETDQNWFVFEKQLDQLEYDFAQGLSNCRYHEVVHIGHLAFGGLLSPYGIKLTALSGSSHEGEHSAKKLVRLVMQMKARKLPAIFTEESVSARLAQTVAAETGTEILPLYSIEHISKRDFENHLSYDALMRRNLDSLKRGLVCR